MIICAACSTPQTDGARFCHECGSAVGATTCRACTASIEPGSKFCSQCGASQVADAHGDPGRPASHLRSAAVRVTSVLFGDIVGFTSLSESRNQEDVRELLSRYFEECRLIIGRYGGTVEKFIGDAVMAVWGVPTAHEDDAERAVRAGLELVSKVEELGDELAVPGLALRVGIVTGEVAVTIGADHQGMVAGDAVNTASRVQGAAEPGQVWVDETTRLLTSSAITYLDVGSHRMKGKADPVPLWSVRAVVAAVRGAQRADGLEAPMVGRDRELRLFKELFHSTEEARRPALFVVGGEPGVGKSRLGWEFEKYVDGLSTPVTWHAGNCVAYGEGVAYYALAEAIRARLGTGADDAEDDPGRLLDAGLRRYVADEEERTWLKPRVGALLGVGSVGTFAREDLFLAWTTFLERAGEGDPVVLLIDDAQYADDGLLQFVEHLLMVADFPCFVVLLTRPGLLERNPTLATNRRATVAHLPLLDAADMSAMIDGLVAGLPADVRAGLVERSDGIPLFAVETVRSLIDRDLVIPRGGRYVLADPQNLDLASIGAPASLQALISARLDQLSAAERRVVDQASVIGTSFKRDTIAALCEDLQDVDEVLATLVRLQILEQVTSRLNADFGSFKFTQSVMPQVAYATLSRRDRKATHLAVIDRYQAASEAGDSAAIVANHYLHAIDAVPGDADIAELSAAAIAQLQKAAARARALGSPVEAVGHLQAALDHVSNEADRPELETDLALALLDTGAYDEAVVCAGRATELFDQRGDRLGAGRAAAAHGTALVGLSDNAAAVRVMQPRFDQLTGSSDANPALLLLASGLSKACGNLGMDVRDLQEVRIRLAELAGDDGVLADCYSGLSIYYSSNGAIGLARVLLTAAADLARENHQPLALAKALLNLAVTTLLDDVDAAVALDRESVEVSKSTGVVYWVSGSEINLALALWVKGEWDEVEEIVNRQVIGGSTTWTLAAAAVRGWLQAVRGHHFDLPWVDGEAPSSDDSGDISWRMFAEAMHAQQTDPGSALAVAASAAELSYEVGATWDDCVHMWPIATEMAIEAGENATVRRLLDLLDGQTDGPVAPGLRIHRTRMAALLAVAADPEQAESLLREAAEAYAAWGSKPYRARTEADLGVLLARQGRTEEAEPLLASARATFQHLGASAWIDELDSRLAATGAARRGGTT